MLAPDFPVGHHSWPEIQDEELRLPGATGSREKIIRQIEVVKDELDRLRASLAGFDPTTPAQQISAEWIRSILTARRRRGAIFGPSIFADPPWDLLLELYAVELANGQITMTRLCEVAGVPFTTGQRRIIQLEQMGLVIRYPDPSDKRLVLVKLSRLGLARMRKFFGNPQTDVVAI